MPRALYVHIPFCRRRCFYCDFAIATRLDLADRYLDTLCREIMLTAAAFAPTQPLTSVFFGGGTPSLLSPAQIDRVLGAIAAAMGIAAGAEISLEANPGTVSRESLRGYRLAGANRISLGVQAFQADLLASSGRDHSVADIDAAVRDIERAGIENFGLDLISGLPGQTLTHWEESLDRAIALQPTHLSAYDLAIEPGTLFGKRAAVGCLPLPPEDTAIAMYGLARERLRAAGFGHYEISNYAKPGYECRHNRTYWENRPFFGVGMGATSYVNRRRLDRPRKLSEYFAWMAEWEATGIPPTVPPVTESEALFDTLMQGLRLAEGVDLSQLSAAYGDRAIARVMACLAPYVQRGWAAIEHNRMRLVPPEGWLRSNDAIADLYALLMADAASPV